MSRLYKPMEFSVRKSVDTSNLVFNMGNGQTVVMGATSNAPRSEKDVTPPHPMEEDAIDVKPHVDHHGRPLS